MTSLRADQVSSTAQTLMSTRPGGNATSRTVSSVISDVIPEAFFGHDTQMAPFCLITPRGHGTITWTAQASTLMV